MLIAGASRHAVEIADVLQITRRDEDLYFYDDVSPVTNELFLGRFPIVRAVAAAQQIFERTPNFVLGLGSVKGRFFLTKKLTAAGGRLASVIAPTAQIGTLDIHLDEGLNVMHAALVSSRTWVGRGVLINAFAAIHHDVRVGDFAEISPRATLLGGSSVGRYASIGAGAVILPNVSVGDYAIVGAGAVVRQNVPDYAVAVGVPARVINMQNPWTLT
jgi:sugar O-acyltransferase (sialic acid O-acetyltransferase NeuD family)